ncbi:mitochondrial carrier domain-containing protein [Phlyctochytrium arcticum]|nr:mitochondrial carrier domain-containing protein [Phlyctochytrium arcticum]
MAAQQNSRKTLTGSVATDQALAGFTAGAASTVLLHPMDLVKTRFQIDTSTKRLSSLDAFRQIWNNEGGVRGLYRGVSPNFAGATLSWGLYFWWYSHIKDWMRDSPGQQLGAGQHLIASAEAGALTAVCTNPFWVIKTRMCGTKATDPGAYKSLYEGLSRLWTQEGVRGLYKGMLPAFLGVSHGALQFMAYEEMKKWRQNAHRSPTSSIPADSPQSLPSLSTLETMAMAASSKIFATVCTYPYQVLRSRLQIQVGHGSDVVYRGVTGTVKTIYRGEGLKGFYKGLTLNVIRVLPGTCVTFAVYETVSSFCRTYGHP